MPMYIKMTAEFRVIYVFPCHYVNCGNCGAKSCRSYYITERKSQHSRYLIHSSGTQTGLNLKGILRVLAFSLIIFTRNQTNHI